MNIQELKALIEPMDADEAIRNINIYLEEHPEDDEALTLRGMRLWSQGRRAQAINDYLSAIRSNPHSKARQALKAANEILDFYNKDLYNP